MDLEFQNMEMEIDMKASFIQITKKEKAQFFTKMEKYLLGFLILNIIIRINNCMQKKLDKGF